MPNQLIHETSPYLLQHADNPVDWMPWGVEALQRAVNEQKPIFLSIGYAACHWCHVMAHESFEDPQIGELLNEHFISIKVDREERPDVDSVYMNAVVTMTGQGGWPLSLFLTPEGEPFYGGTYIPRQPQYGMAAFSQVLIAAARAWQDNRDVLRKTGQDLAAHVAVFSFWGKSEQPDLRADFLSQTLHALLNTYDFKFGGWGRAPRFPQPMVLEYLLLQAARGNVKAREAVFHNLRMMSRGGMHDIVGGGFARYSTDDQWLVPHFEKMLYDNAQLALVYLHAGLFGPQPAFCQTATGTLDFILRELSHPLGGFYSSLDADSEGEEGIFYVWSYDEIQNALEADGDFTWFEKAYGITRAGNFEGKNVLQRVTDLPELAVLLEITPEELNTRLKRAHQKLLAVRGSRIRPATDDKVLVSWNGLALRAFAEAARYLQRADYLVVAQRSADFLLTNLYDGHRLKRSWRANKANLPGFLEDYASLIIGLLALYQTDFNPRWYKAAQDLAQIMIDLFSDPNGGFFDTPSDLDDLFVRPKDNQDNATPCGNSLAAYALLQLCELSGDNGNRALAEVALPTLQDSMVRHPNGFGLWLQVADFATGPVKQIAVLHNNSNDDTHTLLNQVWSRWRARTVVAASSLPVPADAPGLLRDRPLIDDLATAYVCEQFTCKMPVTDSALLEEQLG